VIVALGKGAQDQSCVRDGSGRPPYPFIPQPSCAAHRPHAGDSYHCSRFNTTPAGSHEMFHAGFESVRRRFQIARALSRCLGDLAGNRRTRLGRALQAAAFPIRYLGKFH